VELDAAERPRLTRRQDPDDQICVVLRWNPAFHIAFAASSSPAMVEQVAVLSTSLIDWTAQFCRCAPGGGQSVLRDLPSASIDPVEFVTVSPIVAVRQAFPRIVEPAISPGSTPAISRRKAR